MFFSLLYFFNLHVRQSVTSQLEDVSSYFDFVDDLGISDPLLPSALAPDGVAATVYDQMYTATSMLSTEHLNALAASSAAIRENAMIDLIDKSRKRKPAPSSSANLGVDSNRPEQGNDDEISIERGSLVPSTDNIPGPFDAVTVTGDGNDGDLDDSEALRESTNQKKKRRVSKVEDHAPSFVVAEGNKRKRKKSSAAQDADDETGSLLKTNMAANSASIANQSVTHENAIAPKGKRVTVREVLPTAAPTAATKTIPALLQPIVEKLILSNSLMRKSLSEGKTHTIQNLTLPRNLEALVEYWMRSLRLLDCRLEEASLWRDSAAELMARVNGKAVTGSRHVAVDRLGWEAQAKELLLLGEERGIKVLGREALEAHLFRIKTWSKTATAFLGQQSATRNINCLDFTHGDNEVSEEGALTFLALSEFIRAGELLQVDQGTELADLKSELRKGKSWLTRYNRTAPGAGISAATLSKDIGNELDLLITEARTTLRMDVREELDAISQATRRYCLCRQLYHGSMVGCDECDEWYHFQCMGLTQFQVERADKYVCIRCSLRNSFLQAANLAAQITNRWSSPDEVIRAREARKSRVSVTSNLVLIFLCSSLAFVHFISF